MDPFPVLFFFIIPPLFWGAAGTQLYRCVYLHRSFTDVCGGGIKHRVCITRTLAVAVLSASLLVLTLRTRTLPARVVKS